MQAFVLWETLFRIDTMDSELRQLEAFAQRFRVSGQLPELRAARSDLDVMRASVLAAIRALMWRPLIIH